MTDSFVDLTGFERDVLAATRIVEHDESRVIGKAIRRLLEVQGYEEIKSGRFYPTLDALVERGLLQKRTDPDDERANRYAVTPEGEAVLQAYREFVIETIDTDGDNHPDDNKAVSTNKSVEPMIEPKTEIDIEVNE